MSEYAADAEALAEVLHDPLCHHEGDWRECSSKAVRLLASGVVRPADAVRAEALEQAADEADSIGHRWSGAFAHDFFTFASDLRDRAARLRAGGGDRG